MAGVSGNSGVHRMVDQRWSIQVRVQDNALRSREIPFFSSRQNDTSTVDSLGAVNRGDARHRKTKHCAWRKGPAANSGYSRALKTKGR